jgi:uncharacterized integral membrane protein
MCNRLWRDLLLYSKVATLVRLVLLDLAGRVSRCIIYGKLVSKEALVFYLILVLFVIVGSALTVLTVQNLATSVPLTLFGLKTPGIPPGLLIFLAFLSGALLLYLVALVSARHDQRRIKKLRQRVKELEQEKLQAKAQQPPMAMNMQPPMNMPPSMQPPMQPPMNMPPNMQPPMNMPPNMPPPNMQPPMNMPPNMSPPMNMPPPDMQSPMNMPPSSSQPRTQMIKMPGMRPMQN